MQGIRVYYGTGHGKTAAALGSAMAEAANGGSAIVIRFLKKKDHMDAAFIRRMEPDVKIINFQKNDIDYIDMTPEEKKEEYMNMQNALHYARKVMMTAECSLLVLDEILGLIDNDVISEQDLLHILSMKPFDMDVVLTGRVLTDGIRDKADVVHEIITKKKTKRME